MHSLILTDKCNSHISSKEFLFAADETIKEAHNFENTEGNCVMSNSNGQISSTANGPKSWGT